MKFSNLFRVPYSEEAYEVFLEFLMGARWGLMIAVVIVTCIVFLLWGKVPSQGLLLWAGLAYAIIVIRFFSVPFHADHIEAKQVQAYLLRFAWSTNIYGLIWGLGVVLFMPYLTFEYQFSLILLLAGIAMAMVFLVATTASIIVFPCLLLPSTIWLLLQADIMYMQLGMIEAMILVFFIIVGSYQFRRFTDGVLVHYENNTLIKKLKSEIAEHERTALELQSSKVEAEQASDAKGEFLSLMSHELRTPIHGIIGMLDLLSDAKLNKEHQENLMLAKQASLSLRAVVNDVLDLSKLNAGKMNVHSRLFDITQLLEDVTKIFSIRAKSKGLDFYYVIQGVPEKVFSDDMYLRQILLNIIANAVKFTESGSVCITASREKDRLVIVVEDTGIGIPEDELGSIFDPFKQVHQHTHDSSEGTGLGTSIAQRFVILLGGDIQVHSELGKGTQFHIDIPCEFQGENVFHRLALGS